MKIIISNLSSFDSAVFNSGDRNLDIKMGAVRQRQKNGFQISFFCRLGQSNVANTQFYCQFQKAPVIRANPTYQSVPVDGPI